MQNLSDKELDNLFRKAAAHDGPPYDPADWEALSKRLDRSKPPRPWAKLKIPGILFLLIITSSMIVWNYNSVVTTSSSESTAENGFRENTPASSAGTDITDVTPATDKPEAVLPLTERPALPKAGKTIPDRTTTTAKENTTTIEGASSQNQSSTLQHRRTGENPGSILYRSDRTTHIPAVAKVPSEQKQSLPSTHPGTGEDPNSIIQRSDRAMHIPALDETLYDSATNASPANTRINKTDHTAQRVNSPSTSAIPPTSDVPEARKRRHFVKDAETGIPLDTARTDDTLVAAVEKQDSVHTGTVDTAKPNEKAIQHRYKLGIKLAVSPDYSSVRFTAVNGTGTNYGVLAEYHLTPHWSVIAGGIWSRKIYSATDVEYNGHRVARADGDCRILDIPLNVNYIFKPDRKFSFYTSVGFSTYIMNEEDYVFHVDSGYGSASYSTNVRGKNNELFSIVNVSVGAQKKITDRWSIQLEPFVKVPVKGIGEGDLSLNTLGAFFHLKYSFYNMNNP